MKPEYNWLYVGVLIVTPLICFSHGLEVIAGVPNICRQDNASLTRSNLRTRIDFQPIRVLPSLSLHPEQGGLFDDFHWKKGTELGCYFKDRCWPRRWSAWAWGRRRAAAGRSRWRRASQVRCSGLVGGAVVASRVTRSVPLYGKTNTVIPSRLFSKLED